MSAVNAGGLVRRALDGDLGETLRRARAVDVIAAGKAASAMQNAFVSSADAPIRAILGVGPSASDPSGGDVSRGPIPTGEWQDAGHPLPNEGSMKGASRALEIARAAGPDDVVTVLLSGGGSALMALPAPGLSLTDKQQTARTLMARSADIYELNTVRKHLSSIKGGRLAAASPGRVLTLAVSDVVGDDLSVIASGPTVADESTFADALDVLSRRDIDSYPASVVRHLRRGAAGEIDETPKTGDSRLARAEAHVIGPQRGAIEGARRAAEALGYHVHIVAEPITEQEVERATQRLVAEATYAQDSLSTAVRSFGAALTTGRTVEDVEAWPERLKQVTVDDIRAVARKYLVEKNSVTGILVPAPDQTSRGEQPVHVPHPGRS